MPVDSAFVTEQAEAISAEVEGLLGDEQPERWFGSTLAKHLRTAIDAGRCTVGTVVRLSLLQDCLRVVERVFGAGVNASPEEVRYARPLVRQAQPYLAKLRERYEGFPAHDDAAVRHFLSVHRSESTQPFGGASKTTEWAGRDLVLRLARSRDDGGPARAYESLMVRLIDECLGIGADEGRASVVRSQLAAAFRSSAAAPALPGAEPALDPRVQAFCAPGAAEVFHAITHASDIWRRDPLDVESIHAPARELYERLLDRAATHPEHGSILLVLGDSGSGKTHLMRAFRARAHGARLGYVGYLQMSSSTDSYARYVLHKLLDSLEKPYDAPEVESTGLLVLSDAVLSAATTTPEGGGSARDPLSDPDLGDEQVVELVAELADALVGRHPSEHFEIDLLRALLLLQRRDARLNSRVMKYLRCEPLNARDQRLLGDLAPRTDADDPAHTLEQLGRVLHRLGNAALVLLIDQLEDIHGEGASQPRFRQSMDVVRRLADAVPSAVVVIACLGNFYTEARGALSRSVLDRIEQDPAPVHLTSSRSLEDIEALVRARLAHLYEQQGTRARESEPLFPFAAADLHRVVNLRTRDVLEWFRVHHQRCIEAGALVAPESTPPPTMAAADPGATALEQRFGDSLAESRAEVPDDDDALAEHLAWALRSLAAESDLAVDAKAEGRFVRLDVKAPDGAREVLLGVCNKSARGGLLGRQVAEVEQRAAREGRAVGVVRCSAYPSSPGTQICRQLGALIAAGGRRVVIEDADWRVIVALRALEAQRPEGLAAWRRAATPLGRIEAMQRILAPAAPAGPGRELAPPRPSRPPSLPPSPAPPPSATADEREGSIVVGTTRSLAPRPVHLEPALFLRHAAFLGSTGSGKTTFMLHLLEELLLRGVPALLVDRKGDLVTYGQAAFWSAPPADDEQAARKRQLFDRLDVRVYTPGEPAGRDLGIPVVPRDLGSLPTHERSQVARQAAAGLGAMMSYKSAQGDQAKLVILAKAIELMGQHSGPEAPSVDRLADLIGSEDADLIHAVGHIDTRHFKHLAENLSTLQLSARGRLLAGGGEVLDIDRLLGSDGSCPAGRSRLCVVSTKFLEDIPSVDFWVSRLVLELRRWASRRPAKGPLPQAVVLFDEADIYLPALRKPASKEPLMDLLKRGRSAGIGVLLATQSPGDLDYKGRDNIHTWMLGRIAEKTALAKMKPLLSESRTDVSARLASAGVGEFVMLCDGKVTELRARRSVMETAQLAEDEIQRVARSAEAGQHVSFTADQ